MMGFNVETFELIVQSGFGWCWYMQPIPRTNSSSHGEPRPGSRSLDAWGALGLVLHYLNSTMHEFTLQQIFALIPSTTSRYITFGLWILLETLHEMPEAVICWPQEDQEFQDDSELIVSRHPRLQGAFASIDGLNLPTQTSDDPDIENATYNGWLSEHYINSVIVFSPCGMYPKKPHRCSESMLILLFKVSSLLPTSMPQVVGMTPMLRNQFMRSYAMKHPMDFIWLLTLHFPVVQLILRGASWLLSRLANASKAQWHSCRD